MVREATNTVLDCQGTGYSGVAKEPSQVQSASSTGSKPTSQQDSPVMRLLLPDAH